jgi:transcriptional regulator GlxA family with amidase domain
LSDHASYIEQRQVFRHVSTTDTPDPLFVEETVLRILWRLLSRTGAVRPASAVPRKAADTAEAARSVLAEAFRDRLTLQELAGAVDSSVFHLCRTFRAATGTTIHAYLSQLRLRASLEPLLDGTAPITDIALAHGYSSHSHYTNAFREALGITPSAARRAPHRVPNVTR